MCQHQPRCPPWAAPDHSHDVIDQSQRTREKRAADHPYRHDGLLSAGVRVPVCAGRAVDQVDPVRLIPKLNGGMAPPAWP